MTSLSFARDEFSRLLSRPITIAALIVMLVVPLLYGGMYLWAFWDPYAQLDKVPVALVNLDVPARSGDSTVSAGADLADELLAAGTLDWRVASATEAARGVADGTYYSSLTIPHDFSATLASADSNTPAKAKLSVVIHESKNMIASQIESRVFGEVRRATSAGASKRYYDNVFLSLEDVRGGLEDAADGSAKLAGGLDDARSGAVRLSRGSRDARSGGRALASGLITLDAGAGKLAAGAETAASGSAALAKGTSTLRVGADTLASGANRLSDGTNGLASALATITAGSQSLASSAEALAGGAQRVDAGVAAAQSSIGEAAAGAESVNQGAAGVAKLLAAYAAAHPEAATDPLFRQAIGTANAVAAGSGALAGSLGGATASAGELAAGAHAAATGAAQLAQGVGRLAGGIAQASAGASALASGASELADGSTRLVSGASAVDEGASQLAEGGATLATGASALAGGVRDARDGAGVLAAGLGKLTSGSRDLAQGMTDAASASHELASGLTAGAGELPAYSASERAAHARVMSDPVELDTNTLGKVANYGTGFAPYFIPLALWVGALIVFVLISPLPARAVRSGARGPVVTLAGLWPAALIALGQALLVFVVLRAGLGLDAVNPLAFLGFVALTALVYAAVMQWLSGAFGPAGKLLAMVVLILQLTSAAGTFPLETLPGFFRAVSPWLPMTYAVAGLREAISGGDAGIMLHSAEMLALFGLVAFLGTSLVVPRARSWSAERLEPSFRL